MTSALVVRTAEELGYVDAPGFVTDSTGAPGARDFIWQDLSQKCGVDAAFFKGSVPVVAFVEVGSDDQLRSMQRRLWNFGRVPLLIASSKRSVSVVSCVGRPSDGQQGESNIIDIASSTDPLGIVLAEFSRYRVESGEAMARHAMFFDQRQSVDHQLLSNLRLLRNRLQKRGLSSATTARILGRAILIRYLEDRMILTEDHLSELGGTGSFVQIMRSGREATFSLFEGLERHFNGDVFSFTAADRTVPPEAIDDLANFFEGVDMTSGQQALWPYDFSVIPAEMISSIYEQLLDANQKRDAAYYTPRHLVDLILDETLPWGAPGRPTVMDPACGSGIFLSEAFRRIVYGQTKTSDAQLGFRELSDLLTRSIYGVDMNEEAIGVAAFGLYLALLEAVDPPTVWRDGRLPKLVSTNLVAADFFEGHIFSESKFSVIVGNPPWQSALTPAASKYVTAQRLEIADKQIAIPFLWKVNSRW